MVQGTTQRVSATHGKDMDCRRGRYVSQEDSPVVVPVPVVSVVFVVVPPEDFPPFAAPGLDKVLALR